MGAKWVGWEYDSGNGKKYFEGIFFDGKGNGYGKLYDVEIDESMVNDILVYEGQWWGDRKTGNGCEWCKPPFFLSQT